MFNLLKRHLGIDVLEEDRQFYQKQWTQMAEHFLDINDHLLEMKEILKAHDVLSDKKALGYHLDIMTRLGMILSAMEKVVSLQTVTRGYAVMSSLEGDPSVAPVSPKKRQEKIQQQITDCLQPHSKTGMHYLILAKSLARSKMEVTVALSQMVRKGIIIRLKPGVYALPNDAPLSATDTRGGSQ
jgi:hypothetical protein